MSRAIKRVECMINAAIIQNRKLNTIAIAVLKIIGQVWCGPDVQDAHTTAVIEHTNYVSFSRRHRAVAVGFEPVSAATRERRRKK